MLWIQMKVMYIYICIFRGLIEIDGAYLEG